MHPSFKFVHKMVVKIKKLVSTSLFSNKSHNDVDVSVVHRLEAFILVYLLTAEQTYPSWCS